MSSDISATGINAGGAHFGAPLLRVVDVSMSFPGLKALDRVSLDVRAGEIVAIVGQNGSGKSTLVKILAGVYNADPGSGIEGRDAQGEIGDPQLRFIHQDLGLVESLSTVENLDIGRADSRNALLPIRPRREQRAVKASIARFGGEFDVRRAVAELTAAERAIVAITRAIDGWVRPDGVLVLDEPTAALPNAEVVRLFAAIRRVAAAGAGVIFISHQLEEVMDLSDRVVALRDGRVVADLPVTEVDHDTLVALIAGRKLAELEIEHRAIPDPPALVAQGVGGGSLRGVDLHVGEGEIVGVAGLLGSGREDLAAVLGGATRRTTGRITVSGRLLPNGNPGAAIRLGVGFVPADRRRHGAVMTMSVRENLTLPLLAPLQRAMGRLDRKAECVETTGWIDSVRLDPPRPEQRLELFSGGNQQKVVLAKWLRTKPKVLLLDEPTQGVDVGAKAAVYELLARAAAEGTAILVCSSDTKELTLLCDRVLVLRDGRVGAEIDRGALSEARLIHETLGTQETRSADQARV